MATTSSCSHFLFNLCSSASSSLHRTNSFKRNQRSVFFRLVKLQILVVWNRLSQLYSAVDNNRLSSTPFSIRTSTWTGTWVHTGGEEVAGFTRCRGLAQGPSYDWLGDWDMSLSMISFTVTGDKQKIKLINIQNFKYIILSEHVHFFPAEVSVVPPRVPNRTKIANSNCQKLKMEKKIL